MHLLLGPELAPCPVKGGFNEIDAALRSEVRAVFALDDAALAAAGVRSLGAEIEAALAKPATFGPVDEPPFEWCEPEERYFSTAEAAALFGKSADWVSRGLREKTFVYPDGSPVEPASAGRGGRRRFTADMVRAMAFSAYRRGTVSPKQLQEVLAELAARCGDRQPRPARLLRRCQHPVHPSSLPIQGETMNGNNNIPNWAHDRLIHGYWVIPDRLLATEYPGAKTREKAAEKLATLLDAGVSSFVDLTEAGEKTWEATG